MKKYDKCHTIVVTRRGGQVDQEDRYARAHKTIRVLNRLRKLEEIERINRTSNLEKIESGDQYAVGFENGLLMAISIFNDKEPKFFKTKKG